MTILRRILLLVVGMTFVVIAIVAIFTGHIRMGKGAGHNYSSATEPVGYWLSVAFYTAGGSVLIFGSLKK